MADVETPAGTERPAAAAPPEPSPPAAPAPRRRRRRPLVVLLLLLFAFAAAGGTYWLQKRGWESTDDASIEGDAIIVSPRVAGRVIHNHITDNQVVKAGELLVEIDPADFEARVANARAALDAATQQVESARAALALAEVTTRAAIDEAKSGVEVARATLARQHAEVAAARAEEDRAEADAVRYRALYARKETSRQQLDRAVADARSAKAKVESARRALGEASAGIGRAQAALAAARSAPQQLAVKRADVGLREAQVEQARAVLRQAELDLSYTRIRAPHSGRIAQRSVHEGSFVQVGQSLAMIVYGRPWVIANFKETQLTRMRPGQRVEISIDAYPGYTFTGRVDSMQAGTGSRFALLPPENATGNYVKVVQRVPVKIVFDPPPDQAHFLALGMSVEPRVRVGAPPLEVPLLGDLSPLVERAQAAVGRQ